MSNIRLACLVRAGACACVLATVPVATSVASPAGLEECAVSSLGAPIASQAHEPVLDRRWRWARLYPAVRDEAPSESAPARRLPALPLLDAAALLVEWAGLPLADLYASPQAHRYVLDTPLVVSGNLASRLDALAGAFDHDVVLAYDAADAVLHVHAPPLVVVRAPPGASRLAVPGVLRGAGARSLRITGADGALWAAVTGSVLERAEARLFAVQAAPVAAVLDARLVRLRSDAADAVWSGVQRLAGEVHYGAGGREALSWPALARRQAGLVRDRLLDAAHVHTVRRLLLVPRHLTVLPFDPGRPCASRREHPAVQASVPSLALAVSGVEGASASVSLTVLSGGGDDPRQGWRDDGRRLRLDLAPGAVLALREGLDVLFAQLRPVGTARLVSQGSGS